MMELSPAQRLQVRLLIAGAVLIVVLLALFIYLSIKYPDAKTPSGNVTPATEETYLATTTERQPAQQIEVYHEGEYLDVIGAVREYGANAGGGDVVHYMYTFLIPARGADAPAHEIVRIDNDISCVDAALTRGQPQVHIRGVIEKVVPGFALIMSCRTKGTSVTRVTTGPCWESGNAVREFYRISEGKVYCGEEVLSGADAGTFILLPGSLGDEVGVGVSGLAIDKDAVYVGSTVLPHADVASFQLIGGNYARDSERVYYYDNMSAETRVVPDADPFTFVTWTADTDTYLRLFDSMLDPGFAKDKNNYYKEGRVYTDRLPKEVFPASI